MPTTPSKLSAGLLMYRRSGNEPEFFLVHPGGPYFARGDDGVWSIPKGEPSTGEDLLACAIREFEEETGMRPMAQRYLPLGYVDQAGGKRVHAWAFEGDWDTRALRSNTFEIEWPPRSGRRATFPEIDRAEYFDSNAARRKLIPAQVELLERLRAQLAEAPYY